MAIANRRIQSGRRRRKPDANSYRNSYGNGNSNSNGQTYSNTKNRSYTTTPPNTLPTPLGASGSR